MKINTKEVLKTLKGEELKNEGVPFTVGDAISNILVSSETGGKMKMFVLAQKIYSEKNVEVDESDLNLIKETIESSKMYIPLITGQLLTILNKKKD